MSRRALAPLLAAAAMVCVGCGKSNPVAPSVSGGGAVASSTPGAPGSASPPSSGAPRGGAGAARAFVAAVNLRAADVLPLRASGHSRGPSTPAERQAERALSDCFVPGGGRAGESKPLAEGSSPTFEAHATGVAVSVSSYVSVASSARGGAAGLRALRSPRSRQCLSRYLNALFAAGHRRGFSIGKLTIQAGTPPAPGTTGGFGWRVIATVAADGAKVPFYADILGFLDGPAEVTLVSTGFPVPFPAQEEERLFTVLLSRALNSPR